MRVIVTNDMWNTMGNIQMRDGDAFISADGKMLVLYHTHKDFIVIDVESGLFAHGYYTARDFGNTLFRPCTVTLTVT